MKNMGNMFLANSLTSNLHLIKKTSKEAIEQNDTNKVLIKIQNIIYYVLKAKSIYQSIKHNKYKNKIYHHFNKIISCTKYIRDDIDQNNTLTDFSIGELKRISSLAGETIYLIKRKDY